MLEIIDNDGIVFLNTYNLSALEWLGHAFTSRKGGVSGDVYSSLNLHSSEPEEYKNCLKNRKILGDTLGFDSEELVLAQQVHGNNVYSVTRKDAGNGAVSHKNAVPETDALITNEPGIPLMLLYADCLPVLVADKSKKAVGVVHAGWKGTAAEVLVKTLEKFVSEYSSDISDLQIAIGVGISKCCFEIGEDAHDKLARVNYLSDSFEARDGKIYASLAEINKSQAINFGIDENNIVSNTSFCTFCNKELFYSYRRDNKVTGRHGAVIFIKG